MGIIICYYTCNVCLWNSLLETSMFKKEHLIWNSVGLARKGKAFTVYSL